ncbi:Diacylglycerol kinase [compost metagenome]
MTYIHFIVNPISGKGKHKITREFIEGHFPAPAYKLEIDYSQYKKHAIALAEQAIAQQPDIIVACGGDGTISEIASKLVNTTIKLGIIPVGSGNGLASNLDIPRCVLKSIEIIKKKKSVAIDSGKVNQHCFFSNMGFGIDAMIIKKYESTKKRTLSAYVNASLKASSQYKPQQALLRYNGKEQLADPFLLFISNSNEMGYNMSLTPKASLSDGFLDLLYVPKINFLQKMLFGSLVVAKRSEKFKKAEHAMIQSLNAELLDRIYTDVQIDGEYHRLDTNKVQIDILPKSLNVLVS